MRNPVIQRISDLRKEGIFVSVIPPDGILGINEDTSLSPAKMAPGRVLRLCVDIKERRQLEPFVVHRAQTSEGSHTFSVLEGKNFLESGIFRYEFPIALEGVGSHGFAKWWRNQIHIIHVGRQGSFAIEQISVATQEYFNYLRIQQLYQGQVVRINDQLTVDDRYFQPWSNLLPILVDQMRRRKIGEAFGEQNAAVWPTEVAVGVIHNDPPPPKYPFDNLEPNTAVVLYYNDSQCYGWTVVNLQGQSKFRDGLYMAKVHYTGIKGTGFKRVNDGAIVTFSNVIECAHGAGPDIGLPRCELKGVRPL